MANVRCQHVHSDFLHRCHLHITMVSFIHWRLEDVMYSDFCATCTLNINTLVHTRISKVTWKTYLNFFKSVKKILGERRWRWRGAPAKKVHKIENISVRDFSFVLSLVDHQIQIWIQLFVDSSSLTLLFFISFGMSAKITLHVYILITVGPSNLKFIWTLSKSQTWDLRKILFINHIL